MNGCCKIPVHQECMIYFSFLATGNSFWTLHTRFQRGAATIASIVYEVCDCIYQVLQPIFMSPPSEEDWKQIEHRFNTKWNFPNCIGSLDGKHIMMKCPPNSHSLYYNYKGFFSIVLMALADADYHFIYIDVGNYGSNGNSSLGEAFTGQLLDIPGPKRLPGYPEGVPYPTALWQMRHSPSGWISCDPTPVAKGRTGCPMINLFLTTGSEGQGGL